MAAAVHGDWQGVGARKVHGTDHIRNIGAPNDQGRPAVNQGIPDRTAAVVASEQEFEEFASYFAAHFIDLALRRFADAPIVGFATVKLLRQSDGDVVVVTRIVKDAREPMVAGWRVRAKDGQYRIVDVLVEGGNSLALHFRNQYEAELTKHGIRSLIDRLRRLTAGSPTVALVHQARAD